MFNTTLTSAFVIYMSNYKLKIDGLNIIKEITAYIISMAFILIMSYFYKKLYLWNIIIFLLFYFLYIFITKLISKRVQNKFSFTFLPIRTY